MSEESRFFDEQELQLSIRGDQYRGAAFWRAALAVVGAVTAAASGGKKIPLIGGLIAAAVGSMAYMFNESKRIGMDQDERDLNASKVGLLPREDLQRRHVSLTQQQQADLDAAMDVERIHKNKVNLHHGGPLADPATLEAGHEAALAAGRAEWTRRTASHTPPETVRTR